jgi:hypothetical protein
MATTFLKRQKEMKRQEKQREKAERRKRKKLAKLAESVKFARKHRRRRGLQRALDAPARKIIGGGREALRSRRYNSGSERAGK